MAWSCGIVGLPNAGKSTLFKALTAQEVTIENYPFSTIDPNKAVVALPDQRLSALAELSGSEKVTPAAIEVIDVAGLVEGASRGEGLGNQFLGHLRNVDLLIHVLAGFSSSLVKMNDPAARIEIVNLELCLADLEVIDRRQQKVEPKLRSGEKEAKFELDLLSRLEEHLNKGLPLRSMDFAPAEKVVLDQLSLLTRKEMVYIYNLADDMFSDPDLSAFPPGSNIIPICARLEAELTDLSREEREPFLEAYGLKRSQTERLLAECYSLLNLVTFYTVKGIEAKAWVVPAGIRSVEAAAKVHSDIERGFINVEVISWDCLINEGGLVRAREKGLSHIEGRDYKVQDGDVLYFRFRN